MITELFYIGEKRTGLTYGKKYATYPFSSRNISLLNSNGKYIFCNKKYFVDCEGFRDAQINRLISSKLPWWNFWSKECG